jgi:rhodanese-related sulfurtransferase
MNAETWWLTAGAGVLGAVAIRRLFGGVRAPPEVVAEKLRQGATVVDVRTPREFRAGAFPGAINIPLGEIGSRLAEVPKHRAVIVYCASGIRSAAAARILRRAGHSDVLNAGGLNQMPS